MKRKYKDIDEFTKDIEEEDLRQYILENGIVEKKDFKGMFCNCLFHEEHTPSMQVMPTFFRCYGCGAKGGFISFIMQYKSLTFLQAINYLTDYFNSEIENMRSENLEKKNKIDLEWQMYLRDMENAPENIKKFKKDYWPVDIGYDKRINYLVLPFTSQTNAILGFTKRVIGPVEPGVRPKWKHSSFQEGMQNQVHNVFNLGSAIAEINKTKTVIVTEGPKDVIAFRRIGIQNVVCVSGTSNSRNIWDLFPGLENIIIAYDADDSGIHATIQTTIQLVNYYETNNIYLVKLPDGKDPYDLSSDELKVAYEKRENVLNYVTKYASKEELKELYKQTMLHNKFRILSSAARMKAMSMEEVESWMDSSRKREPLKKNDAEKEKLLAIVNNEDGFEHTKDEIMKAARLLKLKYKIKL